MEETESLRTESGARADQVAKELGALRHDLKNILTAMRSGCTLVGAKLERGEHEAVRGFLGEMLATVQGGSALVERLRGAQTIVEQLGDDSARAPGELAQ